MQIEISEFPSGDIMYRNEAAKFLGVTRRTLDRYIKTGKLRCWKNRVNGRVYLDRADLLTLLGSKLPQSREVWVYARAAGLGSGGFASADSRLQAQVDRVLQYCTSAGIRVDHVVKEISKAGTAHRRAGLNEILEAALRKKISMIVVETPDRLARFAGEDLLEKVLRWHGVEVHVIQKHLHSEEFREELKDDLTELIYASRTLLGEI